MVKIIGKSSSGIKSGARRRQQKPNQQELLDYQTQRTAKRIGRQQKRIEQQTGLGLIVGENGNRQKVIRYQDIKQFEPLTDTQADFFDAWDDDQATGYVLAGSAGVGKTGCAANRAILDVLNPEMPEYKKLIIVRSAVEVRSQGHIPGSITDKNAVYEAPYQQLFTEMTGRKNSYETLKEMGKIEFATTAYVRGITFTDCIVLVDEAASYSFRELDMLVTRVGQNCKIIFAGDSKQDDLVKSKHDISGFNDFLQVTRQMSEFRNFSFTTDDIIRSGMVRSWLINCAKLGL